MFIFRKVTGIETREPGISRAASADAYKSRTVTGKISLIENINIVSVFNFMLQI